MTKTKVSSKLSTQTNSQSIKKEQLINTFTPSFPKTRSSFTEIPRSFKFLPFKIRQIIKNEPKVIIKYQISKFQEFPSFYQVKIYNTYNVMIDIEPCSYECAISLEQTIKLLESLTEANSRNIFSTMKRRTSNIAYFSETLHYVCILNVCVRLVRNSHSYVLGFNKTL